ncbi:YihY family inner membrane protein [Luteimonas sp. FXH3W]|jgi:membrane protein|uniref:UPF0761 membrane protein V3390_00375 n=1 Tax=Aquilutibacter rugosus TaxID=3115820 RepID=A0ABU7UY57_9GAMM
MEPLTTFNRWTERVRDPERVRSFSRFLLKRFIADDLLQAAGALSFTTVFALVPLSMVVFGVLSRFSVFDQWSVQLSDYIFRNFVPSAAYSVEEWLRKFADNAGGLTTVGVVGLVLSLLVTIHGIESAFNRIWRIKTTRPKLSRFVMYWTVLTLGSMLAATSLGVSARILALSFFETTAGSWIEAGILRFSPLAIECIVLTLLYRFLPHRSVKWRHAFAGGILATVLLELIRTALSVYLNSFNASYAKIYGTLAFMPVFLLWIYLSWIAVLGGASMAAAISAFRFQPARLRLPQGFEFYAMLRLLARLKEVARDGNGLHTDRIHELEPIMTDDLIQDLLGDLEQAHVVRRAETGEWLLVRDLDDLQLSELYSAAQLRVPISEAYLPMADDAIGKASLEVLNELRMPLRDGLRRNVSSIPFEGKPDA